jgi:hypothetical protein
VFSKGMRAVPPLFFAAAHTDILKGTDRSFMHQTQRARLLVLLRVHRLVYGFAKAICLFRSVQGIIII